VKRTVEITIPFRAAARTPIRQKMYRSRVSAGARCSAGESCFAPIQLLLRLLEMAAEVSFD
jgi:hypothetical protein